MRVFMNKHASKALYLVGGYFAGVSTTALVIKHGYWRLSTGELMPPDGTNQEVNKAETGKVTMNNREKGPAIQRVNESKTGDIFMERNSVSNKN